MKEKKRTRLSAALDRVKLVFGLLAMGVMAYLFTFHLDADIGVVIFAFLLIAPLTSVLLTWLASQKVTAKLEAPHTLQKGKHFTVRAEMTAESRLPVPFLQIGLSQDANFTPDDPRRVSSAMTADEPLLIPFGMTAQYAGNGIIAPESLFVSDYLGLFRFRLRQMPEPLKIGVIPSIPSLTGAGQMLHSVSDFVMTHDEEEEETAASFSPQNMPGYVHREYVPGDSLRRINWKLSAKRSKLMVRMDEAASAVRPTVILDLRPEHEPERLARREMLMEGALGFLMLLVRQGIACTMHYPTDGGWKNLLLETEDAVRSAAVEMADADFIGDGNRVDPSALQEHAFLLYASDPDEGLSAALPALKDSGYVCVVTPVLPEQPDIPGADAVWQLASDFSMTALRK